MVNLLKQASRINRQKTWIDTKRRVIFSREIEPMKYYFLSELVKTEKEKKFMIIVTNSDMKKITTNPYYRRLPIDDYGRTKMTLSPRIMTELELDKLKDRFVNLDLEQITSEDDVCMYAVYLPKDTSPVEEMHD